MMDGRRQDIRFASRVLARVSPSAPGTLASVALLSTAVALLP
jgi:hypothetical protein